MHNANGKRVDMFFFQLDNIMRACQGHISHIFPCVFCNVGLKQMELGLKSISGIFLLLL